MGLETTHGCWQGAYSAFHRWRVKVCEVAGLGRLGEYQGFRDDVRGDLGNKPWPPDHPLTPLLSHSDCDGEIDHELCYSIAKALEELLPALETAGDGGRHIGGYAEATRRFIDGLMAAHEAGENVEFH